MPRSSRSKSHKQSKHSSKEARDYSDSEEDVKMKDRNSKDEGSVRASRDLSSGEKRKLASSQPRDGKDPSGHGNGDASEEFVASKRRKEKAAAVVDGGGSDRWNGDGDERGDGVAIAKEMKGESSKAETDKGSKSKESKGLVDSKSKTSRRHDSGGEKNDENASSAVKKEESKSGSRVDSKRKSEKDAGRKEAHQYKDLKELKDKDRGSDRERKVQDVKRDPEVKVMDSEMARKQGSQTLDVSKDVQDKRGRENTAWPIQDELRNPELEKELEKRMRRRGDGSSDKDKYQDDVKERDDKLVLSKGDRTKDGKYKDDRHKDGKNGDKYREDGDKDNRHREDKYREDSKREIIHRNVKYREDGERDNRHRDDKYREDSDRDNRHRDEKHREDGERQNRHRVDKHSEDGDRENRRKDDKYREDGDREDRYRDDKYREDGDRDNRHKEEKHREDADRDSRHRDGKQRDDNDREKRVRDIKYRDDRTSESDRKRLRDENNAADLHYRKPTARDGSPIYDDRGTRYKDDKGRRRAIDKEDHSDIRSRSSKEQRSDAEKRSMNSAKVDLVTDRVRSIARNADVEITLNHSRRRSSPSSSSHSARDHYRVSKQEESKYRDYYEERLRPNVTSNREFAGAGLTEKLSSSRSLEKSIQKDDSHLGELSAERRPRSDARGSPLQLVDKSPSSTSNDRRHLNRSDIRRSLDVEESGQRSGGFKDAKDYFGKEGKGSHEMPMETHPTDELSQADGDNFVSSPFARTSNFSGNSRSLLPPPPPPFRTGVDSPLVFGSSEDENRGMSNNRHRRIGDPNMGRSQGNAWKGVSNWPPPPVANGFMPFQHGPPPLGFHPVMQQFPGPPMFGVRPSMELNHTVPYHGRPLGWRNQVDDSCPPLLRGWDSSNAVFGDESHIYGRLDWDHNRTQMSNRGRETSGDMWKGQNSRVNADSPSVPPIDDSARGPADEVWAQNEQIQPELKSESINVSQSSDALEKNTPEAPKTTEESPDMSKMSKNDDSRLCHVYLSKVDISVDLAQPELYDQCMSLMDMDQKPLSDEDDSKILYVEEVVEANAKIPHKSSSAVLFSAIDDSIFQKAMALYKKQREDMGATGGEQVPFPNVENLEFVATSDNEKAASNDGKSGELDPACDNKEAEGAVSNNNQEKDELPSSLPKLEVCSVTACEKLDQPAVTQSLEESDALISTLNEVKMEAGLVSNEEAGLVSNDEAVGITVEDKSSSLENVEPSATNNEEQKLADKRHGPLLFSDVSSKECEAVMPASIESGSVNLSRIHQSPPQSTH